MKVLTAIGYESAIHIHGGAKKPVVIMPPAPGKAPIPVEVNEQDEAVMKWVNKYLKDGILREFKGETESAIATAEKDITRLEGELQKAQDTAINKQTKFDDQVIRFNNETSTLEGMERPTKGQQDKVEAAKKAYDKADLALKTAEDSVATLTESLEAAKTLLEELSE
jgi:chromosome segregation ATPase